MLGEALQITKGELGELINTVAQNRNATAFGLPFGARTLVAAQLASIKTTVYVADDYYNASLAYNQLCSMGAPVVFLPPRNDMIVFAKAATQTANAERLRALSGIVGGAKIIVTTPEALMQPLPPRAAFERAFISLCRGGEYSLDALVSRLVLAGYERGYLLSDVGQFSLRGDILDIWPPDFESPVRVAFFGENAEEIHFFDPYDGSKGDSVNSVEICANTEFFVEKLEEFILLKELEKTPSQLGKEIAEILKNGSRQNSLCILTPLLPSYSHLESFLGDKPFLIIDDCRAVSDAAERAVLQNSARVKTLCESNAAFEFSARVLKDFLGFGSGKVAFSKITCQNRIFTTEALFVFSLQQIQNYCHDFRALERDIDIWSEGGYEIFLCGSTQAERETLAAFLKQNSLLTRAKILDFALINGVMLHDEKRIVIGCGELFRKGGAKKLRRGKAEIFSQPQEGEFVVHAVHGIGLFQGTQRMQAGGAERDYLVIKYSGGDTLYVPCENMDSLSRYISSGQPKLNKIGGTDFSNQKKRVRQSVRQLAFSLAELYATREAARGHKYSDDDSLLTEFCNRFPFEETPDQLLATREALDDLKKGRVMDRLLCGDVGYGKTEVALRLAFKVITEGKQVAFVCPTTVLASQHYNTAVRRMQEFGIKIAEFSRFTPPQRLKENIRLLKEGKIDLAIGTHRLLKDDISFADIGLLILDEEQRFGVGDKEKIKRVKQDINVLTLSATPIPRTLHMSLAQIRDISILDTPPHGRLAVQTYVAEYSDALVVDAARREIERGGSVFIVYNRVSNIDTFAARISALLTGARVVVGHGQMSKVALENALTAFSNREADILIASTIIENGIDIPNANTMIVVDSQRFGLSQMYQLRGRVGRSDCQAYVYFTYDNAAALSDDAYKRLSAITEFTELGSGFRLAKRDLEIRGAGTVMGAHQHGHLEAVGYDMYCKILSQAVEEIRSGEAADGDENDVKVTTDLPSFVPDGYITDYESRLNFYSRLSRISSTAERAELYNNAAEVFGRVPPSVANLLTAAMFKNLAKKARAVRVVLNRNGCALEFEKASAIPKEIFERIDGNAYVYNLLPTPIIKCKSAADLLGLLRLKRA